MTGVEIRDAIERLQDALNILDAISAYSINHQLPSEQLFDFDVRRRLQNVYPKVSSPIYPRLEESVQLSKDEKKALSPYCYKINDSANEFDDVSNECAKYDQQGELIDVIMRGGVFKTIKSVARILDVIGSLALWHMRELEAKTLAVRRRHKGVTLEDKSNAATEMWQYLSTYNSNADRRKLDLRITTGMRWNRFLGGREIGLIIAAHKLPPSLKLQTKLIVELGLIVADMPGMREQAEKATPCMQKLLDSRLGPWMRSKKRPLLVQSLPELHPKRPKFGTAAEYGTPGYSCNSLGALLNAAEHIAAATQDRHSPPVKSPSAPGQIISVLAGSLAGILPHADEEVDAIVRDQPGLGNKEGSTGLESSAKAKHGCQTANGTEIAIVAEVDKLESTLGGYLFEGMDVTKMRHHEKDAGMISFTDTVRLHFAYNEGEDFKLEIWLCSTVGKAILQALRSAEELRSLLGGYLFDGMSECAGAVSVFFPDADVSSDCKMEVMLSFGTGKDVYENIYRRVG